MASGKKRYTLNQAAAICGVSFRRVWRWVRKGDLPVLKDEKGEARVMGSDLVRLLLEQEKPVPRVLINPTAPLALIVEDDPHMGNAIERTLLRVGFDTCVTKSGLHAARLLREMNPALLTLDLSLEQLGGEGVLKVLGADSSSRTKVILITGAEDVEVINAMLARPVNGFLRKPFRPEDLIDLVAGFYERAA